MHPVRKLRRRRGLTLAEVAEKIGISAPSLSRIETGVHGTSDQTKRRIIRWSRGDITAEQLVRSKRRKPVQLPLPW